MNVLEKKRLRQTEYRNKNRELLREKFRTYYNENKDDINERRRDVYLVKKYEESINVPDYRVHS